MNELMGVTEQIVSLALDAASMRQTVGASNIANASVPGFLPSRVNFEDHLARAIDDMRGRNAGTIDLEQARPVVEPDQNVAPGASNGVRVDAEAADLVRNSIQYQALLRGLRMHMDIVQAVVNDGRR